MVETSRGRRLRGNKKWEPTLKLIRGRELGSLCKITKNDIPLAAARLPYVWKKRTVDPGFRNKIFASQWINNNHIVYGTKCNQLVLYDCSTDKALEIPLIRSDYQSFEYPAPCACGIHSIQKNPSETLLATGGYNVNEVGVYRLSELSPYCLLKDCHKDWVFDLRWLDDTCLASCSRDSSLALWCVPTSEDDYGRLFPSYGSSINATTRPVNSVPVVRAPVAHVVSSIPDDRFRAVEHVTPFNLLAVVSMSRRLYMYDAVRMGTDSATKPVFTLALRDAYQEAVALRSWPNDPHCVALATHHCVILFDIRCSTPINASGRCIHPPRSVSGVRSLNFSGDILSYGSSNGQVRFYDLRATKHLPVHLDVGPGWVKPLDCGAAGDEANQFDTIPPASGDNWPPQTAPFAPSWNTPPPSPSPLQSFFLSQAPSNTIPLFSRTNSFVSQVNNLRVRLDHIQNSLLGFHYRRLAMANASLIYSIAGLRGSLAADGATNETASSERESTDGISIQTVRSRTSSTADPMASGSAETEAMDETDEEEEEEREDDGNTEPGAAHLVSESENAHSRRSGSVSNRDQMPADDFRRERLSFISIPLGLFTDFDPNSSLSAHRRLIAVYTHEYDPSGTRLFTAGGPIASTFHGNMAALWE